MHRSQLKHKIYLFQITIQFTIKDDDSMALNYSRVVWRVSGLKFEFKYKFFLDY